MDGIDLIQKTSKIKIGILVTTIISYVCFLISHFLVWGFILSKGSLFSFTGLVSPSAMNSIGWINILFVIGFYNYTNFYFKKLMRKDYRMHWILNNIIIVACTATFIHALIGVYIGWEPWFSLDHVVFGFYVWLVSVIVTIGVLIYLNVIFLKIHELKNLYVEADIMSPFTPTIKLN